MSQLTQTELITEIEALMPNNTSKAISPADVRQILEDLVASTINILGEPSIVGVIGYGSDLIADYTDRTIPDWGNVKAYADAAIGDYIPLAGTVSPVTGNIAFSSDVSLTGVMSSSISFSATGLQLGSSGSLVMGCGGAINMGNGSTIDITAGSIFTIGGSDVNINASANIAITSASYAVTSSGGAGIVMAADYSATMGALSLIHKGYVDNLITGLSWKQKVRAATTANITLSGAQTIDGVSIIAGDRVLVKDQSTAANNGIYLCAAGVWARAIDVDTADELINATCLVSEGTINADRQYTCSNNSISLGVTSIVFVQISGAGTYTNGAGITLTSNIFALDTSTKLSFFAATTSLELKGVISDETGSGALVFADSPVLINPTLGTVASGIWHGAPIDDAYLSNKEVGTIYLEDFSAGSIAANYTVNGAGTFVVSGGSMAIGNGNGAYARYAILKNFLMASDRFEIIGKYTVGDLNTAGIAFGIQSATRSFIVQLDTTTSASSVLKIQNGSDNISGVLADFNTTMAVASGDKIEMYVEYTDNIIRVLCYNKTAATTLKWEYRVIEGESSISITEFTVGNIAIYSVGGNHTLTSFEQKDRNIYNPDYLYTGDSITRGYISKDAEYAYINRLRQEGISIVKLACHSALAGDYAVAAFINYINKINPKKIVNFIGTNDVNTISAARATINYDALVTLQKAAGYTVIHTTAMDRTGISSAINTFNASMKSTYTSDVIVDMNAAMGTATASALFDGTHPYVEGNKVIADTYKKYLNVRSQFLPRNYTDRAAKLFILNANRLASAATFGTTDTQITTSGAAAFSDFAFNGYVNILKLTTMTSEIAYYSGRDSTKLNGLRRGLFGTTALSIASSTDSTIAVILEIKAKKDTVNTPYYQELVGANGDVGFIWNRTGWMATTDLYHFHNPTTTGTTFRISSVEDVLIRLTRNATTNTTEFLFETYTAGSIASNYRLRLGSDGIFIFTSGASASNYTWSSDSSRNFGIGTNSVTYRTTNAGGNLTAEVFIDPARSIIAGNGYAFDSTNGFLFTLANGTRRISVAALQLTNTTTSAGSEVADLAIFTKASGGAMAQRLQIGSTAFTISSGVKLISSDTTDSTSGTTGSLNTLGGIGVTKDIIGAANFKLITAGGGLYIKEGSNATMGTGTLIGGTLVVNTTKALTTSRIFITGKGNGAAPGFIAEIRASRVNATSFTVTSLNPTDVQDFEWIIIEPS